MNKGIKNFFVSQNNLKTREVKNIENDANDKIIDYI